MTLSGSARSAVPGPLGEAPVGLARAEILERVERRLHSLLDEERERWQSVDPRGRVLVDAVGALLDAGGKRVRPTFCVSGYLAAGGHPEDPEIVDAAAALELLHASALLHDDVVDDSPLRRGKPTAHVRHAAEHRDEGWRGEPRRYGESVAIFAGDLALVYADDLAHGIAAPAFDVWSELRTEVMVGQYLDVAVAAESLADERLSRWIAICKSGRYTIQRPLQLGATLAGRPDLASAFEEYGVAIGEAFQLRDDLIGAFGASTDSGKPAGLDLEQQKMTLLLALAVERDDQVREIIEQGPLTGDGGARLRERLEAIGVRDEVEARIAGLLEQARTGLEDAPLDEAWRQELGDMALQAAYRQK